MKTLQSSPIFALCCIALAPNTATAAEFELVDIEPLAIHEIADGACNIKMTGRIEEGDEQRFLDIDAEWSQRGQDAGIEWGDGMTTVTGVSLFPELVDQQIANRAVLTEQNAPRRKSICLDSEGGSFPEALKLINLVAPFGYVTVVPDRAKCWSSCAYLFLAGGLAYTVGGPQYENGGRLGEIIPFRVLHVGADLRIHAPYFKVEGMQPLMPVTFMNDQLSKAVDYLQSFDLYFAERDTLLPNTRFKRELYSAALRQFGPDKWHHVDTVGFAGLYNIHLAGVPEIELTHASLARACSNVSHWGLRMASPVSNNIRDWNYQVTSGGKEPACSGPDCPVSDRSYEVSMTQATCKVWVDRSEYGDDLLIQWQYDETVRQPIWRTLEPWATLPHYYTLEYVNGQDAFGAFHQAPYMNGTFAEIFPVDGAGKGVMISGLIDSDWYGIFLWPSEGDNPLRADGFHAWFSGDMFVQEDAEPITFDFDKMRFCFPERKSGSDEECSIANCNAGSGCNFVPEDSSGRGALMGFPFLSRPIFFDRDSGYLRPFAETAN